MASFVVSVIVPAFNAARYIQDTLLSLKSQTFESFECIVVDDGSVDGTGEVVTQIALLDSRFSLIRQENRGVNAARNSGLNHASGDFVYFLDADDITSTTGIYSLYQSLVENPEAVCAVGVVGDLDSRGNLLRRGCRGKLRQRESLEALQAFSSEPSKAILYGNPIATLGALWRREMLLSVGPFSESLRHWEEYELYVRAFQKFRMKIPVVPSFVGYYRRHSLGASSALSMAGGHLSVVERLESGIFSELLDESIHRHLKCAKIIAEARRRGRMNDSLAKELELKLGEMRNENGISHELEEWIGLSVRRLSGSYKVTDHLGINRRIKAYILGHEVANSLKQRRFCVVAVLIWKGLLGGARDFLRGVSTRL